MSIGETSSDDYKTLWLQSDHNPYQLHSGWRELHLGVLGRARETFPRIVTQADTWGRLLKSGQHSKAYNCMCTRSMVSSGPTSDIQVCVVGKGADGDEDRWEIKLGRWAGPGHFRCLSIQMIELDLDAYLLLCAMDPFGSLMKSMDTFSEKCFYMCKMQHVRLQRSPIALGYNSILVNTPG